MQTHVQQAFKDTLGPLVHFDEVQRGIHATDASFYQVMPACVVTPRNEADLIAALQLAARHRIPTTARGGATSLSGQTHGPGMILDLSRHMNNVLEINPDEGWARVQPGVVRDQLNAEAAKHGLHFAPDPATSSRATIGGMIGNNSSGTRSLVYGKTSDHLLSCRVALADASIHEWTGLRSDAWKGSSSEHLLLGLKRVTDTQRVEIQDRFPTVMRRVSGYALDAFLDDPTECPWNLSRLFCGSEGTLGVLVEAKVKLVPLPVATVVVAVLFEETLDALRDLNTMLEFKPSAIELLDDTVITEARRNPSTRHLTGFIKGDPKALQLVEFCGADTEQAAHQAQAMVQALQRDQIGYAWSVFTDPTEQENAWDVRRLGLGLITNVKGATKGQAFIEDACIPLSHLASYVEDIQNKCSEEGVRLVVYAHSSVGVLHLRPELDLHKAEDIQKMRRISEFAFGRCIHYEGAWAGEHGDGLVRGEFIEKFFGSVIYDAFRSIKTLFDPDHLMNPGKLIDSPPMDQQLRYQPEGYQEAAARTERQALFHYRDQGGLTLAVEQCNGVGACRKIGSGVMCPSYMATRDEKDCPRGRANALRLAISGQLAGGDVTQALASDELLDVMELCLGCKACKSECPNSVDVAKMKAEVLQKRYDEKGTPLGAKIMGRLPAQAHKLCGFHAPLLNFLQNSWPARSSLKALAGLETQRKLPAFATRSLQQQWRGMDRKGEASRGEVALYIDSYTNAYEPHVGEAALELLVGCGYQVTPLFVGDSQRARISKGLLKEAKKEGEKVMRCLEVWAAGGIPILCIEPSCASAFKDDLPDLLDDKDLGKQVSDHIFLIDEFLWKQGVPVRATADKLLVHGHCHQKALFGMEGLKALLPEATFVEAGCCGGAGSFGYEHHAVSLKVGEDRLFPAIRSRDTDTVIVANGFSCRHQVFEACGIMPRHVVEVMAAGRG